MAAVPETETPDAHYRIVSQRIPKRLLDTPADVRQALRTSVPPPMPWLQDASANQPEVTAALVEEYARFPVHAKAVQALLAQVPSAEAFAEPLLRDALKTTFGLDLDVHHTFLFNAVRARTAETHLATADPVVRAFQSVKAATQSLLASALQNFEAFEAEEGGMQVDRRPARVFISDSGQVAEPSRDVDLVPERFAALCRTLDLGARYQRLLEKLFAPDPVQDESAEAAASNRQARFKLFEQSALRLNLHLARLQGHIDQSSHDALLEVAGNGKADNGIERSVLRLWDVELSGIVLFYRPGCLVVYMPDEPRQPVQAFVNLQAFHASLRERLKEPAWRNYFLRFVPARQRDALMQRIQRTLYPKVWNPGGWYEQRFDGEAKLHLEQQVFSAPLLNVLLQRKMAALKDDGLFHAVPTAVEDHKSTQAKIDYFLSVGFNVLNVAAFVVPGLGEVMLGVNAALLGYEVYEGFDSLAKGEREEAWGYFMDVGENLALIAALGAAGAVAHRFNGSLPLAVRSMRPVTLADGSVRLWKPDLAPFAYEIRLPDGLQPDANGLYSFQGRQWLTLEGRHYSVRTLLGEEGYRLEHPTRSGAYAPSLDHNGNGGWLHELDTPEQWRGSQLFHRQGPLEASVSEEMGRNALRISGVSESQLRQTLVERQRPPALLTDTLRRLVLAQTADAATFAADYQASQAPLSLAGQALQRQFRSLPHRVIEEIVGAATETETGEMTRSGRIPLRVADEARIFQQQVRIARACEGLYLDREISLDSARLMLHSLETLAGWPEKLRMGLYDGWIEGPRLTGIGSGDERELAVVWDRQLPGEFCQALFDAIPGAYRERLELTDAGSLWRRLQAQRPASRQRLRQWLGLPEVKPAFRSPMRLADGRVGHPLSGNGQAFFTEDELLDKLRLLELDYIHAEDALQALYRSGLDRAAINTRLNRLLGELLELRHALDRWAQETAQENLTLRRQRSRERIGLALWEHWRRSILPELGQPASRLILFQVQLADFPRELPGFFRERVRSILLDETIWQEGASYARIISEHQLQGLARHFPELTTLDIRRGEWSVGLPQMLGRAWPRLASLGLRETGVPIGHQDLQAMAALPQLRWLDLRGMSLLDMPDTALDGLTLDYLGLDWMSLQRWPNWLNNAALRRIGDLSLLGNRLTELPSEILRNTETVERPLRIVLLGNRFGFQALLDLRLAQRFLGRFTFDLGLSMSTEYELNWRIQERTQLCDALESWANAAVEDSGSRASAQATYRHRIATELLNYWRDSLRTDGVALLDLEDLDLDEFPEQLPGFFPERVRRLDLTRFRGEAASLERFVRRFPQLTELSLIDGHTALGSVPEFLTGLIHLRELALVRMGLVVDQAAMAVLARMQVLSSLQLDGNLLGPITDVSMFDLRYLNFLGLGQMGISQWPEWLTSLLPHCVEHVNLDDNLLTELPDVLLDNHRINDGAVEITLHNNPLSRETMIRAHTSQRYNRPYSFTMDLPEDIAAMPTDSHSSDSEDSFSPDDSSHSEESPATIWQTGDEEQDGRNQAIWAGLQAEGDAGSLLGLISRLRHSADYRTLATRGELVERVWRVLAAAQADSELRLTLNGMAEEPLVQLHQHDTCPDGIRLEFNQMEFQVHTRQALRDIPENNRGPALFRLMLSIFRMQTLDRLAREWAGTRDEAEVRLAYRLRWATQLDLPLPPRGMLYRSAAEIAPGELNQVYTRVILGEMGPELLRFAAQCDFWVAYLREAFADRFTALKEAYEASVLEVTDAYPDEPAEQSALRIKALEDKYKADEKALLETLTFERSFPRT
ncbi:NEL domain-containing protein [Pseudomonas sp. GD04058]|uniref:NEL-type E3 ubiquitin ligase domain-containing protein n=1 Tax=Pseudomonas sp. GD04058 TaxID=2975429 RepID=UPI00244A2A15|nr:DUF6543 domain-containing protein [Pseudomonas sp. GD04058]MDG9883623.1 NEL domain-containing protein [Pseudomonas sp. GD04058]